MNGVVQGVGFRPFVYNLALEMGLNGWVCNSSSGVEIQVDGEKSLLEKFAAALRSKAPPLSKIDQLVTNWIDPQGFSSFEIVHSQDDPNAFIPISPDVTICPDCLSELFNREDRRFRYPFINCTNCGPRFTIIKAIPYDRPLTTMANFPLCAECEAEYTDPGNRRFHAQPVACEKCGPQVWLELSGSDQKVAEKEQAIQQTREMLKAGKIVAIKGLGGFHLACDATNAAAVSELRSRKLRVDKPFAVMMPDIEAVENFCQVTDAEKKLLEGIERPIVVLAHNSGSGIAPLVAPSQTTLGVMLPYTPLHALLLEKTPGFPTALVMTSGNLSEEPLSIGNQQARDNLGPLADAFLMHNREIYIRCDDSVMRVTNHPVKKPISYPLRRSRGYAPYPVRTPWNMPQIFAAGAALKNTFCLTKDNYAFISHHIGDLENYETLSAYEHGIQHLEGLFRVKPEIIAYDLHPDYMSSRYALHRAESELIPSLGVQHHHAHIAACMAEQQHPVDSPVIGLSYDGTGYGSDGTIWGGEVLLSTYKSFDRSFYLKPIPLPGGDAAVKQPWRFALSWLIQAGIALDESIPSIQANQKNIQIITHQIERRINSPLTSSMGRLFDAVSALVGIRQIVNYEGQAAIELEAIADPNETGLYPVEVHQPIIDPSPMFQQIVKELKARTPISLISARFHNTIAQLSLSVCQKLRKQSGINVVALSGGVWQNTTLLHKTIGLLVSDDFTVYVHQVVPANDGGLSLGQAVIAYHTIEDQNRTN
ncbi:MAG: carbamoyltransferase HypF [Chloroflexota bacterium]